MEATLATTTSQRDSAVALYTLQHWTLNPKPYTVKLDVLHIRDLRER